MRKALIILAFFCLPPLAFASTYGSNYLTGGSCNADEQGAPCDNAFDGNVATEWYTNGNDALPHWLSYDLGSGNSKHAGQFEISSFANADGYGVHTIEISGSNDGSTWTPIMTATTTQTATNATWYTFTGIDDANAYRYFRFGFPDTQRSSTPNQTRVYEAVLKECTSCSYATSTPTSTLSTSTLSASDAVLTYLLFMLDAAWFLGCVAIFFLIFYVVFNIKK